MKEVMKMFIFDLGSVKKIVFFGLRVFLVLDLLL